VAYLTVTWYSLKVTIVQGAATVLAELSSARTPWLALAPADLAARSLLPAVPRDVTVIDITDSQAVPVTVNPLEPASGYPVQAHADRLAGLFEAAFGLADPVAEALRAGLRRAYADAGWDMLTGAARPGAVSPPAVPAFRQLKLATMDAARDLGYDTGMQAGVRGFLEARLDALWTGPAGLFLEGGHPADLASLLRGNVVVTGSGLTDEQASWFLAGVLLLRLAEQLSHPAARPGPLEDQFANRVARPDDRDRTGGVRPVIVIAIPGVAPRSGEAAGPGQLAFPTRPGLPARVAAWFGRLLEDLRLAGVDIVVASTGEGDRPASSRPPGPGTWGAAPAPAARPVSAASGDALSGDALSGEGAAAPAGAASVAALLAGRRSAGCGDRCRRRPCSGYEVHAAGLLAGDPGQAWLRLWAQALVLAFLTGRPVPGVPAPLRAGGQALSPRGRECLLATVIEMAVGARAHALRPCYDPRCLTAVVATVAGRMLADGDAVPVRAGSVWVIPQLRWLHEMERLSPLGRDRLRPDDIAPPLDFGLAGLPDWPGIRVADRLRGLRGHPLAMESELNRRIAMTALLGDGRVDLDADLAIAGMGIPPPRRLRHVARSMEAAGYGGPPGWLEVVLSWPHRLIGPDPEVHQNPGAPSPPDVHRPATG
jgi:uncharacterized protein